MCYFPIQFIKSGFPFILQAQPVFNRNWRVERVIIKGKKNKVKEKQVDIFKGKTVHQILVSCLLVKCLSPPFVMCSCA